jgi:AcrR family transcriptional regulator
MAKARQQASLRPERPRKAGKVRRKPGRKPAAATKPTDRARKVSAEARRQAILKAALTVFAAHGFEAARLDDVAARAGVAKGTLYLYFQDKAALFEALVRNAVSPLLEHMRRIAAAPDISPLQALETFFAVFEKEVLGTERKLLLRLIMAEGPRFPAIAEFYYREVVSHGLTMMCALAKRAASEGAFATDAAVRYPQLVVAPLLVAVLWDGLFAKIDPLDVRGLLEAHLEVLTGKIRKGAP